MKGGSAYTQYAMAVLKEYILIRHCSSEMSQSAMGVGGKSGMRPIGERLSD